MSTVADTGASWARAAAQDLLGTGVAVAALDPREARGELLPAERPAVARAVESRRREFLAGRLAARRAMAELGLPAAAIPLGPDRAPVWPEGVVGSISHTGTACLAVVARAGTLRSVGIDLETDEPLPPELEAAICRPEEIAWLAAQPPAERGRLAKLIFSAKEAAYKCQYPLTRTLFGFEALRVRMDVERGTLDATFVHAIGPFAAGACLPGRVSVQSGHVLTAVALQSRSIVERAWTRP